MKRIDLALSIGLAMSGLPAIAQNAVDSPADFGPPPPPETMQQSPELVPAPTYAPPAQLAAPRAVPDAVEPTPAVTQYAPPPEDETRRAAPEPLPPSRTRGADAQTGPYLGRGLFNNWGPDDFGA